MAEGLFGNMVKAVVDVDRKVMALDGELRADEEALLLESGSRQESLWGINIYPELEGPDRIEFDSMINIRPSQETDREEWMIPRSAKGSSRSSRD